MAHDRVIGNDGGLPWHLSADLKRFKALTMGHPNIVVTRDAGLAVNGADCATSLRAALDFAADAERVYVIGGEQIYRLALPLAERIELTEIDATIAGDARFPEFDGDQWNEQQRETHTDPASGLRYDFVTLERKHH